MENLRRAVLAAKAKRVEEASGSERSIVAGRKRPKPDSVDEELVRTPKADSVTREADDGVKAVYAHLYARTHAFWILRFLSFTTIRPFGIA